MIWSFVQVALGGALGASMRYASILGVVGLFGVRFPIGTLFVNILGSLLFCLLYTSPSPRDATLSRMPSSA